MGGAVPLLPGGGWQAAAVPGLFLLLPLGCCPLLSQQAAVPAAQETAPRVEVPAQQPQGAGQGHGGSSTASPPPPPGRQQPHTQRRAAGGRPRSGNKPTPLKNTRGRREPFCFAPVCGGNGQPRGDGPPRPPANGPVGPARPRYRVRSGPPRPPPSRASRGGIRGKRFRRPRSAHGWDAPGASARVCSSDGWVHQGQQVPFFLSHLTNSPSLPKDGKSSQEAEAPHSRPERRLKRTAQAAHSQNSSFSTSAVHFAPNRPQLEGICHLAVSRPQFPRWPLSYRKQSGHSHRSPGYPAPFARPERNVQPRLGCSIFCFQERKKKNPKTSFSCACFLFPFLKETPATFNS